MLSPLTPRPPDRAESTRQSDVAAGQRSGERADRLPDLQRQVGAGGVPGARAHATRQCSGRSGRQMSRGDFAEHRRTGDVDGECHDGRPDQRPFAARAGRRARPQADQWEDGSSDRGQLFEHTGHIDVDGRQVASDGLSGACLAGERLDPNVSRSRPCKADTAAVGPGQDQRQQDQPAQVGAPAAATRPSPSVRRCEQRGALLSLDSVRWAYDRAGREPVTSGRRRHTRAGSPVNT